MYRRLDPFGNPNVGVYVRVTSSRLFLPPGLTDDNVRALEEVFGLEGIQTTVGGSSLVGSLLAANKNGAVIADFAADHEVETIEAAGLDVLRLQASRLNAAGNNILCNDHGAIVHPDLSKAVLKDVAATLGVDAVRADIAGIPTVGTAAVATGRGVLCHPLTTDEERSFIKESLHAPPRIGTVNHGHGLVGAGIAANATGVACGSRTTGIELGRIEEALGFLEATP